jgi:hypothetical protein
VSSQAAASASPRSSYFGNMWELYAMWSWFLVFAAERLFASSSTAASATFAVIGVGEPFPRERTRVAAADRGRHPRRE